MSWHIGSQAFYMTLSSQVDKTLEKFDLSRFIENTASDFSGKIVCHPGGKSILEVIDRKAVSLVGSGVTSSFEILSKYGNMSSITILYVLLHEMELGTPSMFALGFGPGLTVEGLALELC
jgi:alkylresorcinol/alkylpyrone synthase